MKVLIVAAHPDDETFSMGGTLARHITEGDEAFVLTMTDGATARGLNAEKQRRGLAQAMNLYGVTRWLQLGHPDATLDAVPLLKLVRAIEYIIRDFQPVRVYSHSTADVGQDHRRVSEAVAVATRPNPGMCVKTVLAFASPSSTYWGYERQFRPNYFVDVTKYEDTKISVIKQAYPHEAPAYPHTRSVAAIMQADNVNAMRSGLNGYVEAFELLRAAG